MLPEINLSKSKETKAEDLCAKPAHLSHQVQCIFEHPALLPVRSSRASQTLLLQQGRGDSSSFGNLALLLILRPCRWFRVTEIASASRQVLATKSGGDYGIIHLETKTSVRQRRPQCIWTQMRHQEQQQALKATEQFCRILALLCTGASRNTSPDPGLD